MDRFNMSPPPDRGDERYEEKLTNWFLEGAFFRDFVYRGQKGKGGRGDLADGLVLFDRTALFVQSKAQASAKDSESWASGEIRNALRQVSYGERMLRTRLVRTVNSDTLGEVLFDPGRYEQRIGLIVLHLADTTPFVATDLVPELATTAFPVHVVSLADLIDLLQKFDTAADFMFYLEERRQLISQDVRVEVHREAGMMAAMLERLPGRLQMNRPDISHELITKTVDDFRRKVTGELRNSQEWRDSGLIDDIIAHLHDRDPMLPWSGGSVQESVKALELLSYLTRDKRARIGATMLASARAAADGTPRSTWLATRFNRCCYAFLYSDASRAERFEMARGLLTAAMAKSGMEIGMIVATNTVDRGGRAYDVAVRLAPLSDRERAAGLAAPDVFGV